MIRITEKHTGKMKGIQSLSTNTLTNPLCQRNCKIKGSICAKCYANQYSRFRPTLANKMQQNTDVLTKRPLRKDEIPKINQLYFRFEAFGDLHNEIHLENYLTIAKHNPKCRFGLWTKNYELVLDYFFDHDLPENVNLIISSLMINRPVKLEKFKELGIKVKSFTVYNKEFVEKSGININCGAKSCISCLKCYTKNDTEYINELLKSDQKKKEVK